MQQVNLSGDTNAEAVVAPTTAIRNKSRERVSTMLSLAVTLAALLFGLLARNAVESRTKQYTDLAGVELQYPETWQLAPAAGITGATRVQDLEARRFPTTFLVRSLPVDSQAPVTQTLGTVAASLSSNRASDLIAYKLFSTETRQTIKGLPGAVVRYVYVDAPTGLLEQNLPTVVLGDDYIVSKNSKAYIFSMLAAEDEHPAALVLFERFVDAAQIP